MGFDAVCCATGILGIARGGLRGLGPPKGSEKNLHTVLAVLKGQIFRPTWKSCV